MGCRLEFSTTHLLGRLARLLCGSSCRTPTSKVGTQMIFACVQIPHYLIPCSKIVEKATLSVYFVSMNAVFQGDHLFVFNICLNAQSCNAKILKKIVSRPEAVGEEEG